jgi:predicted protein tyrosine phosphatase
MKKKVKILFVCTYNKMRSRTAEEMYKHDHRFEVKSAGIDDDAGTKVNLELLTWADYTVVMEEFHRQWIQKNYPIFSVHGKIRCIDIPDYYDFMDPGLASLIREKFEALVEAEMDVKERA